MTTSHLIELPTQLILADTPLRPDSTNEVLAHAKDHGKPSSRVYISHGHPDHFAGARLAGWLAAIVVLEGLPYNTIRPGHGLPGDRGLYCDARAYLPAARALCRRGRWPRRPQPAPGNGVPGYGGTTMRPLQSYFPYPGPSLTHSHEQPG